MANEKDKEYLPLGTFDFTNGLFNDKNFKDLVHNIFLRWSLEENFFYLPLLSSDEDDCMPLDENNKWKIEDISCLNDVEDAIEEEINSLVLKLAL